MRLAKFFNHNFDKGVFKFFDNNDNIIYYENSKKYWCKKEFDKNNNVTCFEDSNGFYWERNCDVRNNEAYWQSLTKKI